MRYSSIVLLAGFLAGLNAWGGDEFPARPGEQVAANELIIRLRPGAAIGPVVAGFLSGAQTQALGRERLFRIRVPAGIPNGVSTGLANNPLVDFVEPNRMRSAVVIAPNDPNYTSSWWFQTVQALPAWSLLPGQYLTAATTGAGRVKVAVLDTGADCTHPDFVNTGGSSTDSAQGGQLLFSASQSFVANTLSAPACGGWQDDHGHGTHVTGIVAAATSNALGVSGLAYPVQVIEYKVLDSGGNGFDTDIATAIMDAADAGAQVVSLSLGGAGYSQTLQTAVNYAWQRNTLVVAAAGNSATSALFFPAGANHAIGVSATDAGNNLASFSNFGPSVHLAAPGVGILSTAPTYTVTTGWRNYISLSGTSMATPFVSALAGLVAMSTPNATAQSILQRLEQTANSNTIGGGWDQNFGYGIINAANAVTGSLRTATNGAVAGQIVDAAGNPITGAQIKINGQTIMTTSPALGLFRFSILPAGTYSVSVSASGYPPQSLDVTVAPGTDTPLTVTMGATYGKFTGIVSDQSVGVPGAIVQALSGGLILATAVADLNGHYNLWVPASGTFDVRASAIERNTQTLSSLTLSSGGATTANLTLTRMGIVAGTVRDGNLNPVANAQVLVTSASFSAAANTDGSGNFSLIGLPSGSQYSATATATGFVPSTQNGTTVSADVTTNVNFTMVSSTVATPTFNPPAGTYSGTQSVTISTTTAGASIRYTTNGSTPSSTLGTVYSGPVAVSGSLTLKAIAYKSGMTDSLVASAAYTINSGGASNTALFVKTDTTTQGTWKGVYGSNGYNVIGDTVSYPGYVTVTPANQNNYTWAGSTSDVRAPQKALSSTDRIAATWYNDVSFTIDLNFTDGAAHQLAIYCLDWDLAGGRAESLSVLDGSTGALLDTQNLGAFQNGTYVVWKLSGHVLLRITRTGAINGVVSGLFFDPVSSGSSVATPTFNPPAGNYSGTQSVTISTTTPGASIRYTTNGSTPSSTLGTVYAGPVPVSGSLTLKAIAYKSGLTDSPVASAVYTISSGGASNTAVFVKTDTTSQGNWKGVYGSNGYNVIGDTVSYPGYVTVTPANQNNYTWASSTSDVRAPQKALSSTDRIAATWYNDVSFTIDLNFTDGAAHQLAIYCLDWDLAGGRAESLSVLDGSTGALLDTQNLGAFQNGTYVVWKLSGHVLLRITRTGAINGVVSGLFFDPVSSGSSVATPTFNPPAGNYSGTQNVTISTSTAGASIRYTTDGSTPSSTVGTLYAGPVPVGSSLTLKAIAYKSGLTDSLVASAAYTISSGSASNSAVFVKTDTAARGTWKGVYGSNGYNVIGDTVSYPGYVTVTPANQNNYTWAGSTSDVRGPQKALSSTDRIAATWYNDVSFTIDLNFTDGAAHQLAIYCLDWDLGGARAETLSVLDGSTGAALDTQNLSAFQNGTYVVWKLSGHVALRITRTGAINGVISGLFFDPVVSGASVR